MAILLPEPVCMYCDRPTPRGKKGEHIVPEALGGALTLNDVSNRRVCRDCNSGPLSLIDRELCSRSFVSVAASQLIDSGLWQAWEVDHEAGNQFVEARPVWNADGSLSGLACYPQITFEKNGQHVRCDPREMREFGYAESSQVLFSAVRHCFGRYRSGASRAIHFEHVRTGALRTGHQYAPRMFTRRSIAEIAKNVRNQSFILRFASERDKQYVLQSLPVIGDGRSFKKWEVKPGSHWPTIGFYFDMGDTLRALLKIGLNLIAAHCPNTVVSRDTYANAVAIILGEAGQIPQAVFRACGFIRAGDNPLVPAPDNGHVFRLCHAGGVWHVYSSFFGGRVGSYVMIEGPNNEAWRTVDVVAPLRSKQWDVKFSPVFFSTRTPRIEWLNGSLINPSFELQSSVSSLTVERVLKKVRRSSRAG